MPRMGYATGRSNRLPRIRRFSDPTALIPMSEVPALLQSDYRPTDGSRFLSAGRDDDLAIVADDGRTVSYARLRADARVLGERFGKGKKLILIVARNEPETISTYVAALNAGHAVIVIGPEPIELIDHVCTHFNPNFICHRNASEWLVTERHADQLQLHPELACLLSTSGTTGEGKFVRLSYRNLITNALSIAEYLGIVAPDRFLLNLPINYSYGLSILDSHLVMGARLLVSERSVTDPELWNFFRANDGSGLAGVPHTYKLLDASKFESLDLPSLRTLTQAGGRLPEPLARRFAHWSEERGVRFFIMYGQTEASPRISYLPPELAAIHPDCIGRAIPGGTLTLVDAEGKSIDEVETAGELQYAGPNVMMGYASHIADLALEPGPEVLKTGDLAVINRDGLFRITGREKRFLKIYGLRISLDEIERKLEAASIRALCGGNDEFLGVLTTDDQATDQHLLDQVSHISGLPSTVITLRRVHEFPLLSSGKIDYRTISQELLKAWSARSKPQGADVGDPADASPGSRIEAVFRENLPGKPISAKDTFVSLGGDSLSYVAVALGLEELIPALPAHWEKLTVEELDMLASQSASGVSGTSKGRRVESAVLVRAVAPVFVVMNHAGLEFLAGGAALLLAIVGMNFSRFQLPQLIDGRWREVLWNFAINVLLPYWIILVGFQVLKGEVNIPEILLYGNFVVDESANRPFGTWFIQVVAQSFVILCLVLWFQSTRRIAVENTFRFAMILLAVGTGVRLLEPVLFGGLMANGGMELSWVFWIFAMGLALGAAEHRRQKVLLSCLIVLLPQICYPMNFSRSLILTLGCLLVIWAPRIHLHRLVVAVLGTVGSASLFIYMLHPRAPINSYTADWPIDLLRILIGIGLGIGGWWGYGKVQSAVKRYLEMLRERGEATALFRTRE